MFYLVRYDEGYVNPEVVESGHEFKEMMRLRGVYETLDPEHFYQVQDERSYTGGGHNG